MPFISPQEKCQATKPGGKYLGPPSAGWDFLVSDPSLVLGHELPALLPHHGPVQGRKLCHVRAAQRLEALPLNLILVWVCFILVGHPQEKETSVVCVLGFLSI